MLILHSDKVHFYPIEFDVGYILLRIILSLIFLDELFVPGDVLRPEVDGASLDLPWAAAGGHAAPGTAGLVPHSQVDDDAIAAEEGAGRSARDAAANH